MYDIVFFLKMLVWTQFGESYSNDCIKNSSISRRQPYQTVQSHMLLNHFSRPSHLMHINRYRCVINQKITGNVMHVQIQKKKKNMMRYGVWVMTNVNLIISERFVITFVFSDISVHENSFRFLFGASLCQCGHTQKKTGWGNTFWKTKTDQPTNEHAISFNWTIWKLQRFLVCSFAGCFSTHHHWNGFVRVHLL